MFGLVLVISSLEKCKKNIIKDSTENLVYKEG